MNGISNNIIEGSLIDRRPIITCAGELEVFSALEDLLSQALPKDSCEWQRARGRPIRSVHIGATFTPFSANALPKGNQWDLIRQPLFHVYWTECTDIDLYKSSIRDDIETWLKEITTREITDWLIVVVENYDGKRATKLLPRTTVLDKIRADFASKQGDRCISVINPGRVETRSADSWRGLVGRVRHLILIAYARAVMRLEEHVRQQREKRNEPGWNFMQYFKLQEELAQVLEMLGLYDEALVQYDELDALFSQFIVNGHVGDAASWLNAFQRPLDRWYGLKLGPCTLDDDLSLLELRAYLFAKQAHMLLLTNKIWEMASRCLPFLHTCTRELALLDISTPPGAVACWLFLACVEVLQICDEHNQADQVEEYSANTAALWAYASQKLRDLGELCGLMPGQNPTSQQLHTVVGLSAGMGDCAGLPGKLSPTDKLKKALSSQEAFNKNYLELAELAMGTYKHIGYLRSARLIGREVASFYILLGELQKAAAFLTDALKTFEYDGWHELAAQTHLELAECYRKADDKRKFIRDCAAVSAAPEIDNLIRWSYFDEMQKSLDALEKPLIVPFENIIKILSVSVKNEGAIMQGSNIDVELIIDSNFPREVLCTNVVISLENEKESKKVKDNNVNNRRTITNKDLKCENRSLRRLKIQRQLDYRQDKQLSSASIVCKTILPKRKDSTIAPQPSSFHTCLEVQTLPLVLTPSVNVIRLTKQATAIGKYYLGQVAIHIKDLNLVSLNLNPKVIIKVKRVEPVLRLDKGASALLSGLEQIMQLSITIGSYEISSDSVIKVMTSRGLTVQHLPNEPLTSSLEITVQDTSPFSSTHMDLRVFSELPYKEHQVTLVCPWMAKPIPVLLSFTPLLSASWRLHTVAHRKFVHVNVNGQSETKLELISPCLDVKNGLKVTSLNIPNKPSLIAGNGGSLSFAWELQVEPNANDMPIKAQFSIRYKALGSNSDNQTRIYSYVFEILDYLTLYIVESTVEPTKGNEFCRVGALCNLNLCIKRIYSSEDKDGINSLMYEVLAEQSIWAVCGRTAGVVSFETDFEPKVIVLDVMPLNTGYLPLPLIRLSKYIPADVLTADKPRKSVETHPRLCPFNPGQVYNASKGQQVHVIAAVANDGHVT